MRQGSNGGEAAQVSAGTSAITGLRLEKALSIPFSLFHANLSTGVEVFAFASRRMAAQVELLHNMSRCVDLETATKIQGEFLARASEDYGREVCDLIDLARDNLTLVADIVDEPSAETSH